MMKAIAVLSRHWLLCLASVMQQGLFCGPQHQIISYDNELTVKWRRRFDWNSGRNTADACDANAREMSVEATAHFIFVAATIFTEVRTPFPS